MHFAFRIIYCLLLMLTKTWRGAREADLRQAERRKSNKTKQQPNEASQCTGAQGTHRFRSGFACVSAFVAHKPSLLFANRGDSCEFDRRFFHSTGLWLVRSLFLGIARSLSCSALLLSLHADRRASRFAGRMPLPCACALWKRTRNFWPPKWNCGREQRRERRTNERTTSTKCAGKRFLRCCMSSMTDTQL